MRTCSLHTSSTTKEPRKYAYSFCTRAHLQLCCVHLKPPKCLLACSTAGSLPTAIFPGCPAPAQPPALPLLCTVPCPVPLCSSSPCLLSPLPFLSALPPLTLAAHPPLFALPPPGTSHQPLSPASPSHSPDLPPAPSSPPFPSPPPSRFPPLVLPPPGTGHQALHVPLATVLRCHQPKRHLHSQGQAHEDTGVESSVQEFQACTYTHSVK